MRHADSRHAHLAGLALHLNLGHCRHIGGGIVVAHIGHTPAFEYIASAAGRIVAYPRLPARFLQHGTERFETAGVLQHAQPILGRIGLGSEGQLVHERLVGEAVFDAAR